MENTDPYSSSSQQQAPHPQQSAINPWFRPQPYTPYPIAGFPYQQYPVCSTTQQHAQPYAPLEQQQHHSSAIPGQYTHHRPVEVVRPLSVRPAEPVKPAKQQEASEPTDQTSSSPSASANAAMGGSQPICGTALLDMDYMLPPKDKSVLSSTNTGNSAEKNQKSQLYSPKNYYSSTEKENNYRTNHSYRDTQIYYHTQDRCYGYSQPLPQYNPLCSHEQRPRSRSRTPPRAHSGCRTRDRRYSRSRTPPRRTPARRTPPSRTPTRRYNRSRSRSRSPNTPSSYKHYRRSRSSSPRRRSRQYSTCPDRRAIPRSSISPFSSSCSSSSSDEDTEQPKLKPRVLFKVSPHGATAKKQSIKHSDARRHSKPESRHRYDNQLKSPSNSDASPKSLHSDTSPKSRHSDTSPRSRHSDTSPKSRHSDTSPKSCHSDSSPESRRFKFRSLRHNPYDDTSRQNMHHHSRHLTSRKFHKHHRSQSKMKHTKKFRRSKSSDIKLNSCNVALHSPSKVYKREVVEEIPVKSESVHGLPLNQVNIIQKTWQVMTSMHKSLANSNITSKSTTSNTEISLIIEKAHQDLKILFNADTERTKCELEYEAAIKVKHDILEELKQLEETEGFNLITESNKNVDCVGKELPETSDLVVKSPEDKVDDSHEEGRAMVTEFTSKVETQDEQTATTTAAPKGPVSEPDTTVEHPHLPEVGCHENSIHVRNSISIDTDLDGNMFEEINTDEEEELLAVNLNNMYSPASPTPSTPEKLRSPAITAASICHSDMKIIPLISPNVTNVSSEKETDSSVGSAALDHLDKEKSDTIVAVTASEDTSSKCDNELQVSELNITTPASSIPEVQSGTSVEVTALNKTVEVEKALVCVEEIVSSDPVVSVENVHVDNPTKDNVLDGAVERHDTATSVMLNPKSKIDCPNKDMVTDEISNVANELFECAEISVVTTPCGSDEEAQISTPDNTSVSPKTSTECKAPQMATDVANTPVILATSDQINNPMEVTKLNSIPTKDEILQCLEATNLTVKSVSLPQKAVCPEEKLSESAESPATLNDAALVKKFLKKYKQGLGKKYQSHYSPTLVVKKLKLGPATRKIKKKKKTVVSKPKMIFSCRRCQTNEHLYILCPKMALDQKVAKVSAPETVSKSKCSTGTGQHTMVEKKIPTRPKVNASLPQQKVAASVKENHASVAINQNSPLPTSSPRDLTIGKSQFSEKHVTPKIPLPSFKCSATHETVKTPTTRHNTLPDLVIPAHNDRSRDPRFANRANAWKTSLQKHSDIHRTTPTNYVEWKKQNECAASRSEKVVLNVPPKNVLAKSSSGSAHPHRQVTTPPCIKKSIDTPNISKMIPTKKTKVQSYADYVKAKLNSHQRKLSTESIDETTDDTQAPPATKKPVKIDEKSTVKRKSSLKTSTRMPAKVSCRVGIECSPHTDLKSIGQQRQSHKRDVSKSKFSTNKPTTNHLSSKHSSHSKKQMYEERTRRQTITDEKKSKKLKSSNDDTNKQLTVDNNEDGQQKVGCDQKNRKQIINNYGKSVQQIVGNDEMNKQQQGTDDQQRGQHKASPEEKSSRHTVGHMKSSRHKDGDKKISGQHKDGDQKNSSQHKETVDNEQKNRRNKIGNEGKNNVHEVASDDINQSKVTNDEKRSVNHSKEHKSSRHKVNKEQKSNRQKVDEDDKNRNTSNNGKKRHHSITEKSNTDSNETIDQQDAADPPTLTNKRRRSSSSSSKSTSCKKSNDGHRHRNNSSHRRRSTSKSDDTTKLNSDFVVAKDVPSVDKSPVISPQKDQSTVQAKEPVESPESLSTNLISTSSATTMEQKEDGEAIEIPAVATPTLIPDSGSTENTTSTTPSFIICEDSEDLSNAIEPASTSPSDVTDSSNQLLSSNTTNTSDGQQQYSNDQEEEPDVIITSCVMKPAKPVKSEFSQRLEKFRSLLNPVEIPYRSPTLKTTRADLEASISASNLTEPISIEDDVIQPVVIQPIDEEHIQANPTSRSVEILCSTPTTVVHAALTPSNHEAVVSPINEAVVSPINEAVVSPINEAVASPIHEAVVSRIHEAVVSPINEAVVSPINEAVVSPINEAVVSPINEAVSSPIHEAVVSRIHEAVESPIHEGVTSPIHEAVAFPSSFSPMRLPIITPPRRPSTQEMLCEVTGHVSAESLSAMSQSPTIIRNYVSPRNSPQAPYQRTEQFFPQTQHSTRQSQHTNRYVRNSVQNNAVPQSPHDNTMGSQWSQTLVIQGNTHHTSPQPTQTYIHHTSLNQSQWTTQQTTSPFQQQDAPAYQQQQTTPAFQQQHTTPAFQQQQTTPAFQQQQTTPAFQQQQQQSTPAFLQQQTTPAFQQQQNTSAFQQQQTTHAFHQQQTTPAFQQQQCNTTMPSLPSQCAAASQMYNGYRGSNSGQLRDNNVTCSEYQAQQIPQMQPTSQLPQRSPTSSVQLLQETQDRTRRQEAYNCVIAKQQQQLQREILQQQKQQQQQELLLIEQCNNRKAHEKKMQDQKKAERARKRQQKKEEKAQKEKAEKEKEMAAAKRAKDLESYRVTQQRWTKVPTPTTVLTAPQVTPVCRASQVRALDSSVVNTLPTIPPPTKTPSPGPPVLTREPAITIPSQPATQICPTEPVLPKVTVKLMTQEMETLFKDENQMMLTANSPDFQSQMKPLFTHFLAKGNTVSSEARKRKFKEIIDANDCL